MLTVIRLTAIFMIALCVVSTGAKAQKSIENSVDVKQVELTEEARINAERSSATKTLAEQRAACYQKFAVTPCLNEARDIHREKMQDLKRQEVALNDARRKRAAAEQLNAIEQRNSPQAQLSEAQRKGNALEATKKREESLAERQLQRDTKQRERSAAAGAASPQSDAATNGAPAAGLAKPQPTGKLRQQPPAKVKPELRPGQAEKMAKSRQQAEQREKDAEMRRAEALQREAKRKKPPSAGLKIQD